MDKIIENIITKIYLNGEKSRVITKESVQKTKADLERLLGKIKEISFNVQISKDEEYQKIEYGKTCAVALDIIVTGGRSKLKLIVQISKLGNFGKFYWTEEAKIIGGKRFYYELPKDWPIDLFEQIKNFIENYGIKFLTEKELAEKCEAISNYFDNREKATVDELIFCYDGGH